MNKNIYSLFLCALLASTLVHELRAKSVVPVNSPVLEAAKPAELERVKRDTSDLNLDLSLQVTAKVLVISNSSANAALVINVTASLFLLLNGTSGSGVCVDRANNNGSYISEGLWKADNQTLENFLNSLEGGISDVLNLGKAVAFHLTSVKASILQEITNIVVCLIVSIDAQLEQDVSLALEVVLSVVDGVLDLLNGVLEGLLDVVGNLVISLNVDICGLLSILKGLATVIEKVAGDLVSCIKKGVEFKLAVILGAANGLICLINLIHQLGKVFVLSTLAEVLGTVESLFLLIAQLGGNACIGINGIFKVVGEIAALINNNSTLDIVLSCLLQYVAYSSIYIIDDLTDQLNNTLTSLLDAVEDVGATEVLSDLVDIVDKLIGGTLVVSGCDLSAVINKLLVGILETVDSLLTLVIKILLLLVAVVKSAYSIPYLLLVLISQLNCVCGVKLLKALGIDVKLGSLLKTILSTAGNLIQLLLGNLYNVLKGLPVIGDIVVALNSALEEASGGKLSLKTLLDASTLVKNLIKGVFQVVTGLVLGISSAVIAEVKVLLENVTSVKAFTSIDITAVVSVSA